MKLNAIALALGLASSSAFAGVVIQIDPDGSFGTDAVQAVTSLGWNNGNTISTPTAAGQVVPDPTGTIQTYGQGSLGTFNGANSSPIGSLGLNSAYEWTYVFGAQENAFTTNIFGISTAYFSTVGGGDNFFRVYYSPVNASNVNGTGFTDGTLVMSGTIRPDAPNTLAGSFTVTNPALVTLDGNSTDNYAGQSSTGGTLQSSQGTGSTKLVANLDYVNNDFIKSSVTELILTMDTFNAQPFDKVDPSSCFTNGAGGTVNGAGPNNAGGTCANSIGDVNGISGPNIMFMTRATTDFNIPEPASLALVGAGLLSALGLRRKRA